MKTKNNKKMAIYAWILMALSSQSACAAEQIKDATISKIYTYKNLVVVAFNANPNSPPVTNVEGCTHSGAKMHVAIKMDANPTNGAKAGEEMHQAVLAARLSGFKIGFGVSGCMDWSTGKSIPIVYRVDL